jgi:hypothetical protein
VVFVAFDNEFKICKLFTICKKVSNRSASPHFIE